MTLIERLREWRRGLREQQLERVEEARELREEQLEHLEVRGSRGAGTIYRADDDE